MDNSIGVGAIVGLMIFSSIYIWNSENFSKTQKTVLLLFIIFPPLQWISIFIVIAYNKSVKENTKEFKTEKKQTNAIDSLKELNEKGILTDEEYQTKVYKIETEKAEQTVKNSLEYQQLKSLLDSGILNTEEFESKIKLLNIKPKKVEKIEEKEDIEDDVYNSKQYRKHTEKDESMSATTIAIIIAVVLIISLIIYIKLKN